MIEDLRVSTEGENLSFFRQSDPIILIQCKQNLSTLSTLYHNPDLLKQKPPSWFPSEGAVAGWIEDNLIVWNPMETAPKDKTIIVRLPAYSPVKEVLAKWSTDKTRNGGPGLIRDGWIGADNNPFAVNYDPIGWRYP